MLKPFSALLIATVALIGCEGPDHAHGPEAHGEMEQAKSTGEVIREFKLSKETYARFIQSGEAVTLTVQGPIAERAGTRAMEDKLMAAATLEKAYRLLDAEGVVPASILEHDQRPASEVPETEIPQGVEAAGPGSRLPTEAALAKKSDHANPASDANWNWTADANWWKDVVGYKCGWHEALHYTNVTWADDWRQGWFGKGYLLAASHTYGANAYAYQWVNGAWSQTHSMYLQPRHYVVWTSGDTSKRWRRYRVVGLGAYPRIHWGMRWDSQAPSDIGVICQY